VRFDTGIADAGRVPPRAVHIVAAAKRCLTVMVGTPHDYNVKTNEDWPQFH
jgi:hypothetical protein